MAVDVEAWGVDLLTLSAHKFHGPKGVGALYVRKGVALTPLVHGGSQEGGLRAGTENTMGIIGLGRAAELAQRRLPDMDGRVRELRDRLWAGLREVAPDVRLNGHSTKNLPNTLNVSLPGVRGESMVLALDQRGISLSSGSACRSGSPEPSHALLAMGLTEEEAHCALRFSLGIKNTADQIDRTVEALARVLEDAAGLVRFVPCR
jgi:cysteine sulfinate desulfinase/cysteine desulfurase-like protein